LKHYKIEVTVTVKDQVGVYVDSVNLQTESDLTLTGVSSVVAAIKIAIERGMGAYKDGRG
jgi:hypothetical protein